MTYIIGLMACYELLNYFLHHFSIDLSFWFNHTFLIMSVNIDTLIPRGLVTPYGDMSSYGDTGPQWVKSLW